MTKRREFLQAAAAAGAVGVNVLPGAIEKALAIPARRVTGTIKDVKHIVVLMQENRSFDHLFGTLKGVRGFGDPRPATLPSGKTVFQQPNNGTDLLPFHPTTPNLGLAFLEGTAHDWTSSHQAWNQGRYDQWVPAKGTTTMAYFQRADVPFHYALADAFTICDAYHCSLMGPTDPNRYHMWTGWVGNDGSGGGPVVDNAEAGYGWSTFPEKLEAAGVSWKIYQDQGVGLTAEGYWGWTDDAYIGNYGDNSLLYFHQYQNATPGQPLYDKARVGTNAARDGQGVFFDQLRADVAAGTLPQVSWIVAPEAYSEHPNWPANYGAWYVSQVLDILTSNPELWSQTALFVTYDENDGFFDHVVPPTPASSPALGQSTVDVGSELFAGNANYPAGPYGLGQRVPMIVASPWSRGGWVCSETFDHTSIIRFMEQRFDLAARGLAETNITPWRRAVVGDLTAAFDFANPNGRSPKLPATTGYLPPDSDRHPSYVPQPPSPGAMPVQEPGLKWSRALPYALGVAAHVDATHRRVGLRFDNTGRAGAVFRVSQAGSADAPRTFTVESGKSLKDQWTTNVAGVYDLTVTGPGGFFRHVAGDAGVARSVAPEVLVHEDREAGGALRVVVRNEGNAKVHVTLRANAYTNVPARHASIAPGAFVEELYEVGQSLGWYDFSVTVAESAAFLRRFAGRVETGAPSVSDPANSAQV
jgi:phospholipase C